jgi:polar amino acid transport system substrate-binding protein
VLGVFLAFLTVVVRNSGKSWAGTFVNGYHAILGGMPIAVVLMLLYYVVFGAIDVGGEVVSIIAFTLSFGATAGATMWTGVQSIDAVQTESGLILGYTRPEVFRKIVFPQAALRFLPQLSSQLVSLVKETSVVGFIAVQDLTRAGDLIRSRTMEAFFPLVAIALIYFALCRLLAWGLGKFVNRYMVQNRPRVIKGVKL